MNKSGPVPRESQENAGYHSRWPWLAGTGCLLILVLAILIRQDQQKPAGSPAFFSTNAPVTAGPFKSRGPAGASARHHTSAADPAPTAEQIVASKVSQFARDRRAITQAMAKHFKVEMPGEVERFFEAAEAGRWDEMQSVFESLNQQRKSGQRPEGQEILWGPLLETFGVAEQAHLWPAQELLDYGQAILGSLRPGMMYVGGTDPGRFIPTLLNETSEGEHHIVVTQNALADGTYLKYLDFLYGDRMGTLNAGFRGIPHRRPKAFETRPGISG